MGHPRTMKLCQALAAAVLLAGMPALAQEKGSPSPEKKPATAAAEPSESSALVAKRTPRVWEGALEPTGDHLGPSPLLMEGVWWFSGVEFHVKMGPVEPLNGFFEEHTKTGWMLEVAARETICRPYPFLTFFGELGLSYMENDGVTTPEVTNGQFFFSPTDTVPDTLDDFFLTRLNELRRAGVHAAFGAYYYPPQWNPPGAAHSFHISFRGGGRVGHVHADYDQTPTPALGAIIDALGQFVDRTGFTFISGTKESDIYAGLFGSVGIGCTCYDLCCGCFSRVDVSFGAELEAAHDWFDLGDYGPFDRGLATFTPKVFLAFTF